MDASRQTANQARKGLRQVWHDPVWSKVIASSIVALAGLAVTLLVAPLDDWFGSNWRALERWFNRSALLDRGEFVAWLVLAFAVGGILGFLVAARRDRVRLSDAHTARNPTEALSSLEKSDLSVLKVFGLSPTPLAVNTVAANLRKMDRPRILLAIDRLVRLKLLIPAGITQSNNPQYEPTAVGREACHKKGWI